MMDGSLPTKVFAEVLTQQFPKFVMPVGMVFPEKLCGPPPVGTAAIDIVQHPDGNTYVIRKKTMFIMFVGGIGDLPVYKEMRNRIGVAGFLGNAQTFDHREEALKPTIPSCDVRRFVSDGILDEWGKFCDRLTQRPGRQRIGYTTFLDKIMKTVSGIQPRAPLLSPWPVASQIMTPEFVHMLAQNTAVTMLFHIKRLVHVHDPSMVCD
jgi:hypothetical protein